MSKHRQTILLGILGLILAYYAGEWVFETVLEGPKQSRLDRGDRLAKSVFGRAARNQAESCIGVFCFF